MKRNLKVWIMAKTILTVLLLMYACYTYFLDAAEENELRVMELLIYAVSSLLLIYTFFKMYDTMIFVVFFDFILIIGIGYYFNVNYFMLLLDSITALLIMLDHNDIKNFIKRKLRKINIHLKH